MSNLNGRDGRPPLAAAIHPRGGHDMMTVLVQFKLPGPLTIDQAREAFAAAAPEFQEPKELVRKYFLLSEDGTSAGGVYLWTSEKAARSAHEAYSGLIKERFGSEPSVTFFHSPVVVDNRLGRVETDAAAD
jgi:hypothetical protein